MHDAAFRMRREKRGIDATAEISPPRVWQNGQYRAYRMPLPGLPETFSHLRVSVSHVGDRPQLNRKQCGESIRLSASIVLRLRAFRLIPTIDLMLRRM